MRSWLRSEKAFWAVLLPTGLLCAVAGVAWPVIGSRRLAIVLAAAVVLWIAIGVFAGDDDPEHGFSGPLWGEGGERWSMSDSEFEALVRDVERRAPATGLAAMSAAGPEERAFARAVRDAIDELPDFVKDELDRNVAVIVADDGASPERYGHPELGGLLGLYVGWTAARPTEDARIILFRDTLTRGFEDPDELRRQIATTLRHEIAHHFGADERRVQELGL
jgi:predicted Zn-dependent protease with MMP-like domain